MPTTSTFALGAPDGRYFSLGRLGDICLAAGRTENGDCTGTRPARASGGLSPLSVAGDRPTLSGWIRNVPGDDITVFDCDSVADGYWLYAGNDWAGSWTNLGHANGTHSFDIGSAGLDSARYLRIVCDSTSSPSDPGAGLDLDAVSYRSGAGHNPILSRNWDCVPSPVRVFPNPTDGVLYITAGSDCRRLEIIDITGRPVKCYPFRTPRRRDMTQALGAGDTSATRSSRRSVDVSPPWDCPLVLRAGDCTRSSGVAAQVPVAGLASGVYLARIETAAGVSQRKFVVVRP